MRPPNYLLLDNIAVSPTRQGSGLGRRLLAFAEDEALRRGYYEIRLHTHQTMVENQRLYTSIGYEETGRGSVVSLRDKAFFETARSTSPIVPLARTAAVAPFRV